MSGISVYLTLKIEASELVRIILTDALFNTLVSEDSKHFVDAQTESFYETVSLFLSLADVEQHEVELKDYQYKIGSEILKTRVPQSIKLALKQIQKQIQGRLKRLVDLKIITEDDYLESVPWELIGDRYVAKSSNLEPFSVTRFVDVGPKNAKDIIADINDLRIMIASSQPLNLPPPSLDMEFNEIIRQFTNRETFPVIVDSFDNLTYFDFVKNLQSSNPTVLHISLHSTTEGVLFRDNNGYQEIPFSSFLQDIKLAPNLLLVVLDVCDSARPGKSSNFARALVESGIPAVIGMTTKITRRASAEFCRRIYLELSNGHTVLQSFDRAVRALRNINGFDRLLWCVPILYHSANVIPFPISSTNQEPILRLEKTLRVFLCHSSQDKQIVRELYTRLRNEGWIDPWLDEKKILAGQDWDLEIEKAVEETDAVIVFLSSNSIEKEGYVQKELRYILDIALEKPEEVIFIIPLRLENIQPPRRLRRFQFIDYFPKSVQNSAYQSMLASLRHRAKKLGIKILGEI